MSVFVYAYAFVRVYVIHSLDELPVAVISPCRQVRGVSRICRKAIDENPHLWRSWVFDLTFSIGDCSVHAYIRDLVLSPSIAEKLGFARSVDFSALRQKAHKQVNEILRLMSNVEKVALGYDDIESIAHVAALTLTTIVMHVDKLSAFSDSRPSWCNDTADFVSNRTVLEFLLRGSLSRP